jgi:L-glyceraldehyde 3-phosphate reductase
LGELGVGCIPFSPLAQGLLTNKYLGGIPEDARAAKDGSFSRTMISDETLQHVRALADVAKERGQSLAQMAIAWVLRDPRVTTALIGARTIQQLEDSLAAVRNLDFSDDELKRIDQFATDAGINIWGRSSAIKEIE